jgi:hypothetical protein
MPEIFNADDQDKDTAQDTSSSEEKEPRRKGPGRHVDEYSAVMQNEVPSRHPWHAYAPKPEGMTFDSQHDEERVLLLLRQHPVTQLRWIIMAVIGAFLPFLFSYVGFINFLPPRFQLAATIGWYLLIVGFALEAFLNWFFNVYIITDERVVDVDFYSLLYRNISYAKIEKIEDISAVTSGTLGAVFDFGTVNIQTAGSTNEFEFEHVPHPSRVTSFLNEMLLEEEREVREGRAN